MQGVVVEPARQARQQFGERRRDQFEPACSADTDLTVRSRRQHQEGHQKPGDRADRDLHNAIDRGIERIGMAHFRDQEHDHRRHGGCVKAGIDGCNESQRRDRQHQQRKQSDLSGMRNQHRDGAAIDRAAHGPEHVITGRLQRSADAHLSNNERRQHCP